MYIFIEYFNALKQFTGRVYAYLVTDVSEMDYVFGLDEFFFFFSALDFFLPDFF